MYRILYVDDEPGLLEIGKLFLTSTGEFDVSTLTSAEEAIHAPDILSFDAIVSDYQMPGVDGILFLKNIRDRSSDIPFILFTGRGREEVVIEAINSGADFYLQKGGDPTAQFAELSHKIRIAIERRRALSEVKNSEQRLNDIINFLPDATFAIDRQGTVIAWNRAMEQITGTAAADILGKGDYEYGKAFYGQKRPMLANLILNPDTPFEEKNYTYTDHARTTLTGETVVRHEGKNPLYIWAIAGCLYNKEGENSGAIESIRDITGRKLAENELRAAYEQISAAEEELRGQYESLAASEQELEKYKQQLEEITDTLPGVVYQFYARPDGSRGISYVSGRVAEVFGISSPPTGEFMDLFTSHVEPRDREMFLKSVDEAVQTGQSWSFEGRFNKPSGETIWFSGASHPIKHGDDLVYSGIFLDITERKSAESELRAAYEQLTAADEELRSQYDELTRSERERQESENRFSRLIASSFDAVIMHQEGKVVLSNSAAARMLGAASPVDLIDRMVIDFAHPSSRAQIAERIRQMLASPEKTVPLIEEKFLRLDGKPVDVEVMATSTQHEGKPAVMVVFRDITERKRTEEDLFNSRQLLQIVLDAIPQRVFWKDKNSVYLGCNLPFAHDSGYPDPDILKGQTDYEMGWKDNADSYRDDDRSVMETGTSKVNYEEPQVRPDGSMAWLRTSKIPLRHKDGEIFGVLGTYEDITERKLAEEDLFNSRQLLQVVLDTIPQRVFWKDKNSVYLGCNKPLAEDAGYADPGALIGKTDYETASKEIADKFRADDRYVMETGESKSNYEEPQVRPDGSRAWLRTSKIPLRHKDGEIFGILGTYEDITERKIAEEGLRESEERYRSIIETANEGIWILDKEFNTSFINQRLAEILGYTGAEMAGRSLFDFVPNDDRALIRDQFAQRKKGMRSRYECRFRHRDGKPVWCLVSGSPLLDRDGAFAGSFGMITDINERKQTENALKLANNRLNLLTSITRHDIRNQLTLLSGYLELSGQTLNDPVKTREFLEKEKKIAEMIALQIRFTRDYEELGSKVPEWQDVARIVHAVTSQLPLREITIDTRVPGIEIYADPLLEKVFYNLIDNALRYGGGKMHTIRIDPHAEEGHLIIGVEDDGVGIPDTEKTLIFEHGHGKNTGLGLFLSREILAITGLSITETGAEGKGARFEITVPDGAWRARPARE